MTATHDHLFCTSRHLSYVRGCIHLSNVSGSSRLRRSLPHRPRATELLGGAEPYAAVNLLLYPCARPACQSPVRKAHRENALARARARMLRAKLAPDLVERFVFERVGNQIGRRSWPLRASKGGVREQGVRGRPTHTQKRTFMYLCFGASSLLGCRFFNTMYATTALMLQGWESIRGLLLIFGFLQIENLYVPANDL